MKTIKLSFDSTLEQGRAAAVAASYIAEAYCLLTTGTTSLVSNRFVEAVELSVGEACTNSIKHRPEGDTVKFFVTFEVIEDIFIIRVRDRNEPIDFYNFPSPDPEKIQESGYGLHIMKAAMDDARYERVDGWNIVHLQISLPQEVPSCSVS